MSVGFDREVLAWAALGLLVASTTVLVFLTALGVGGS
jgi:hypothetical protein